MRKKSKVEKKQNIRIYNTLNRREEEIKLLQEGKVLMYTCGPTVYSRMQFGNLRMYVDWDIFHRALMYLGFEVNRYMNITDVGHMTSDENFGEDKLEKSARQENLKPLDIADKYIVTILQDFRLMNILHPDGSVVQLGSGNDIGDSNGVDDSTESGQKSADDIIESGEGSILGMDGAVTSGLVSDGRVSQVKLSKSDKARALAELSEHHWIRATDEVDAMIEMIKKIEKNGFTYETDQALYYDVTKYDDYTALSGQKLEEKQVGVRDDVVIDPDKRHPADFVLWMKNVGKYKNHVMKWESPWGVGFPGWHIECSAMSSKYLGEKFDIHTGGVDHITVHHPNERAQNFAALGHTSVNYWVHGEFITAPGGEKLSKSKGNSFTLMELMQQGFDPMDLRYYFLTASYRQQMVFSFDGLKMARQSRLKLVKRLATLYDKSVDYGAGIDETNGLSIDGEVGSADADADVSVDDGREIAVDTEAVDEFKQAWADDLNSAQALAVLAKVLDSVGVVATGIGTVDDVVVQGDNSTEIKTNENNDYFGNNIDGDRGDRNKLDKDVAVKTVLDFDKVLGLRLRESVLAVLDIPDDVQELAKKRQVARQGKNYKEADRIREEIEDKGYVVEDSDDGSYIVKSME